ncbi:MAG TPA: LamG domain-containing protein [Kofleriaceae bacterium]
MHRRLVVLALTAGCGSVQNSTPDGMPPDGSVDLARGCALEAQMDEASWLTGSPVVNSCGGSGGQLTGMTAMPVSDAIRGRVGSFSGNACVNFTSTAALHGTTGLTMSAWVKPTGLNGVDSNGVITKRVDRGVQSEYSLNVWTGYHVWVDFGDVDRYSGTATLSNNVWVQLTAVFDGTRAPADRVRLFINGVPDPLQHAVIGNLGTTLPSYDSPVHVGCTPAPMAMTQQTFIGELDNVTIWNRALSDAEIAQLYANG